jgi:glycosylphosphatidylinositol transamidase (GPIT) subunit GPI8
MLESPFLLAFYCYFFDIAIELKLDDLLDKFDIFDFTSPSSVTSSSTDPEPEERLELLCFSNINFSKLSTLPINIFHSPPEPSSLRSVASIPDGTCPFNLSISKVRSPNCASMFEASFVSSDSTLAFS